jgi:hypothetical protein
VSHRQHYYIVDVILIAKYVLHTAQIEAVVIQEVEVEVEVEVVMVMVSVRQEEEEEKEKEEGRGVVELHVDMNVIIMMITLNVDAVWIHVLKILKPNVVIQIFAI